MKRLIPSPWLSLGLLGGWLLLTRSFSAGQLLLGIAVALVMPLLMAPLRPTPGPLRRWARLLRLILRVGVEVVHSALLVAAGVLRMREQSSSISAGDRDSSLAIPAAKSVSRPRARAWIGGR